ncbi:hypothetical protein N9F58_02080 [Akkermansiaceae bacterium]|nr:hypothetical protein [Akkermansiaceae bacterium]MDB4459404.1 hypothetical protein [bacterium]
MIRTLTNLVRYTAASARGGTVRYYCGNLQEFYKALYDEGINPVILRWDRETPITPQDENNYQYDVDHLISNDQAKKIGIIAGRFPGKIKCDFYSVSGQSGSSYQGMPYYPPVKALSLLDHAILHEDGYFHLIGKYAFYSYAYHMCYHKGPRSGIPLESDPKEDQTTASRDYTAELIRLATLASIQLPDPISITSLDQLLRDHGWGMPYDLMIRWPDEHTYLKSLIHKRAKKMAKDSELAKHLTVFIIRSDCEGQEMKNLVKKLVGERFSVLQDFPLTKDQQVALINHTRGGDWIEKYTRDLIHPVEALICQNRESPGPVPGGLSSQKLIKRYPHVEHTDVLIKRNIRKAVNTQLGHHQDRVVLHATDNAMESGETLRVLLGEHWAKDLLGKSTNIIRTPTSKGFQKSV